MLFSPGLLAPFSSSRCFCLGFESIPERDVVAAFAAELLSLPFPLVNPMLQTKPAHHHRFATLHATILPLHSQLIFPLP
jgi:hypothetical protein